MKDKVETEDVVYLERPSLKTPILEVMMDDKFDELLAFEIKRLKKESPGEGKRFRHQYGEFIENLNSDRLKREYPLILWKRSKLSSNVRMMIRSLIESCALNTVKFYELNKLSENGNS